MQLPTLPPSVYVAGLAALATALVLVLTKRWHGRFSMDGVHGVQKAHANPTPRIGGVATMASGVLGWWLTGIAITSLDVPGLDWLLQYTVFSV